MGLLSAMNRLSIIEWLLIDAISVVTYLTIIGFVTLSLHTQQSIYREKLARVNLGSSTQAVAPTSTPLPEPVILPVTIYIPKIKLQTDVVEIGFDQATQELEVPHDSSLVGWYKYGVAPGKVGTAILSGHYDTPTGAPAIFYNLKKLQPGDEIVIITNSDKYEQFKLEYQVKNVYKIPITAPDFKDKIYDAGNNSQITLLTCAGIWDPVAKTYSHRLAVVAQLVNNRPNSLAKIMQDDSPQQQVVELNQDEEMKRVVSSLVQPYLRVEQAFGKLQIYMATNKQEVGAADLTLKLNQVFKSSDLKKVQFTNTFNIHQAEITDDKLLRLSFFNSNSKDTVTTSEHEVLLVQIPIQNVKNQSPEIEIVKGSTDYPVLLSPVVGEDLREGTNILKSVEVTHNSY